MVRTVWNPHRSNEELQKRERGFVHRSLCDFCSFINSLLQCNSGYSWTVAFALVTYCQLVPFNASNREEHEAHAFKVVCSTLKDCCQKHEQADTQTSTFKWVAGFHSILVRKQCENSANPCTASFKWCTRRSLKRRFHILIVKP